MNLTPFRFFQGDPIPQRVFDLYPLPLDEGKGKWFGKRGSASL